MVDTPTASEVAEDVGFTEADLDDNMIRQPSLVAHYGRLLSELQFATDTAKQILSITESKGAQQMRDEAADEGKKITEALINSSLPTLAAVMKAQKAYNRAKADFEAMKVALEALRHKKDMMIQIGVNRRSELENKIRGLASSDAVDGKAREARDEGRKVVEKMAA